MIALPKYEPPRFTDIEGVNLYEKLKNFLEFWSKFANYHASFHNRLRNILTADGSVAGFSAIAAAETIRPERPVQPVEGTTTIQYIYTPDYLNEIKLLAVNGFTLGDGGNIAIGGEFNAGSIAHALFHLVQKKWYVVGASAQSLAIADYREER